MNINIYLYGNRLQSTSALTKYKKIISYFNQSQNELNFQLFSPNWSATGLNKKKQFVLPLLLIPGKEYEQLKQICHQQNITLLPPTATMIQNKSALLGEKQTFQHTVFLLHGSKNLDVQKTYANLESELNQLGAIHFCYIEGIKTFDTEIAKLVQNDTKPIKIKPIMFLQGKHINIDLNEYLLKTFNPEQYQILPCLGDDLFFLNKLLEETKRTIDGLLAIQ